AEPANTSNATAAAGNARSMRTPHPSPCARHQRQLYGGRNPPVYASQAPYPRAARLNPAPRERTARRPPQASGEPRLASASSNPYPAAAEPTCGVSRNGSCSVDPAIAVVEDCPPDTATATASKYDVPTSRWWRVAV